MRRSREILTRPLMTLVPILSSIVLFALVASATAAQVTETWTGGAGDWVDDETLWSPLVCSTPACTAFTFPRNGVPTADTTYAIQIDGGNAANSVVTLDVGISIDTLTVGEGDQLTLVSGNSLRIDGGTVTNNGTILLNSSGTETKLSGFGADLTLGGTGTIVMSDRPPGFGNFIKSDSSHRLTNAAGHTIRGPGNFGNSGGPLTNHGLIDADSPSGNTLVVWPNADDMINTGTMQASNGGVLRLSGGPDRTFTNTGGLIQALADSVVELGEADIVGGTLSTTGTGVIRSLSATVDGVTITGTVEVPDARHLDLKGTVTNNGTIALNATAALSATVRLGYITDATLTGTGTVTMSNDLNNVIKAGSAGLRLTHGAGHTIQGAGDIGQDRGLLTNLGTIIANQPTRLEIDLDETVETFTNQGTLQADAGSTLNVIGDFNNAGTIVANGNLKIGSTGTRTVTQLAGGMLSGGGTVQGNLVNGGEVNPGASAGTLTVTRNFTQQAGGVLNIELGGTGPGEFDKLAVTGTAALDGSVKVSLVDGFVPTEGQMFQIMTFASRTGKFAALHANVGSGLVARLEYSSTDVKLVIVKPDHFFCYKAKSTRGDICSSEAGVVFAGASCDSEEACGGTTEVTTLCVPNKLAKGLQVVLADQFEDKDFDVKKPVALCAPAEKNGESVIDPDTHLEGYQIREVRKSCVAGAANAGHACSKEEDCGGTTKVTTFCQPTPKHVPQVAVLVENQFGSISLDTIKPDRLLVPTAKSLTAPVPAPAPGGHFVDHFKCYKVKVTPGTPKFEQLSGVAVKDQFIPGAPKLFDLKKPTRLCTPVDKNGEGITNETAHLLCYQAKPAKGEPKHVPEVEIFVNNQFGPAQLDTIKEDELCVPSTKIP